MLSSGDCHSFPGYQGLWAPGQSEAGYTAGLFIFIYFLSQKQRSFLPSSYSSSLFHKTGRDRGSPEPMTRMETSGSASVFNTYEPSDTACPHIFRCLYISQSSSVYWSSRIHGPLAYIGVEGGTVPKQA